MPRRGRQAPLIGILSLFSSGCASPHFHDVPQECFRHRPVAGWSALQSLPMAAEALQGLWDQAHPRGQPATEAWFSDTRGSILMCEAGGTAYVASPAADGWRIELVSVTVVAH